MIEGPRVCPKCDIMHEGEGVSPSLRNKIYMCGKCYKEYNYERHRPKSVVLDQNEIGLFKYTKPIKYIDSFCDQCNKKLYKQCSSKSLLKHFCNSKCSDKFWKAYIIPDAKKKFSARFGSIVANTTNPV